MFQKKYPRGGRSHARGRLKVGTGTGTETEAPNMILDYSKEKK